jgi:hypothetical protein
MEALTTTARLATACRTVKCWRDSKAMERGLDKVMLAKTNRAEAGHYTLATEQALTAG